MRVEHEDEMNWLLGRYIHEGIIIVANNILSKNGKKMEYPDKPYLQMAVNRELTEEEIKEHTDNLFAMLGGMQQRFEESKRKESSTAGA